MITGLPKSKSLVKHISCKCRWKMVKNGEKCTSKQEWKKNKCWCECKKPLKLHICKGYYICNARTGACKCEYLNNYTRH